MDRELDEDDVLYLCEQQVAISGVPMRAYRGRELAAAWGLEGMPADPVRPQLPALLATDHPVMYLSTPYGQYAGVVRAQGLRVIAGPIGLPSLTRQQRLDFAFSLGIGPKAFSRLHERMSVIPPLTLLSFVHLLTLMRFMYTGERLATDDVSLYLQATGEQGWRELRVGGSEPRTARQTMGPQALPASGGGGRLVHNALAFEREMLGFVRAGDEEGLRRFLGRRSHRSEGIVGPNVLRDRQNMLVVVATVASRAAVEGGLPEDEAMRLSDSYIMRSEALFSADAVMELQARMVVDFTRHVSRVGLSGLDPLAARAIIYIRRNISSSLTGAQVAKALHVSRQTLCTRFSAAVGAPLGEYVTGEKIRRAEGLLEGTDHGIADIAGYLGYSSQSHFQTRFKQVTGITPGQWRTKSRQDQARGTQ